MLWNLVPVLTDHAVTNYPSSDSNLPADLHNNFDTVNVKDGHRDVALHQWARPKTINSNPDPTVSNHFLVYQKISDQCLDNYMQLLVTDSVTGVNVSPG